MGNAYLSALKPPNRAPLAMPTQKPIVKPIFMRSKQLGWPCWEYALPGTAGIFKPANGKAFINFFPFQFDSFDSNELTLFG